MIRQVCRYLLVFSLVELFIIGLLLFTSGFFLNRASLDDISSCDDFGLGSSSGHCWIKPKFDKAVLLVIDALRYDFALFDKSVKRDETYCYQNKLPVFEDLCKRNRGQARLFRFLADPPTTTLQRLKGLTTGSLPTFIDASKNFASGEINEDNIIDQLIGAGKRVVFLGDDTWTGLFPNRFLRSYHFPSFDIMDLDTVDEGILAHLPSELQRTDWNIIIAHFLGVDHCGHKHGPNHPQMAAKLTQMNDLVKNISKSIDDETLLLVFGDHGMTRTGDHGGDSLNEIHSALFVYSPKLSMPDHQIVHAVNQVDIVPTLALLLNCSIPFSNLGKVITDLVIDSHSEHSRGLQEADFVKINKMQVERYISSYSLKTKGYFPSEYIQKLKSINSELENANDVQKRVVLWSEFIMVAHSMCEEVWAKFDVDIMVTGLIIMSFTMFFCLTLIYNDFSNITLVLFYVLLSLTVIVNIGFGLIHYYNWKIHYLVCFIFCFPISIMLFHTIRYPLLNAGNIIPLCIVSLLFSSTFSNSFVVHENYVISFCVLSLSIYIVFRTVSTRTPVGNVLISSKKFILSYNQALSISAFVILVVSLRSSFNFQRCREEQSSCETGSLHILLAGLEEQVRSYRYIFALISVVLIVWSISFWLRFCGNLNGTSPGVLVGLCLPKLNVVLISVHWAIQASPFKSDLKVYEFIPSHIVYFLTVIHIGVLFVFPIMVYLLPQQVTFSDNFSVAVREIFCVLRDDYKKESSKPVVYGLATAVSAPMLLMAFGLLLMLIILGGDGYAPAFVLLMMQAGAAAILSSLFAWSLTRSDEQILQPRPAVVILWFMLSLHGFYCTGHQPVFSAIHWNSAFVGFSSTNWDVSNAIPAILVVLNTFSSHILFGFLVNLLVFAPLTIISVVPNLVKKQSKSSWHLMGDFYGLQNLEMTKKYMAHICSGYLVLHALKVLFSSYAGFVLRRHLMVWKIFAPHFIFDAVGFLVSVLSVSFGYLFSRRVLACLSRWLEELELKYA